MHGHDLMTRADELCTDCGICCDGTLFSSVALEPADVATARQHRLPLLETRSEYALELPCAALRGVLCGIDEDRPEACAEYACELRIRVEERRLSVARARAIIDETRTLRARVAAICGTTPWWVARRSAIETRRADPARAADPTPLLANLDALEELVRTHFW